MPALRIEERRAILVVIGKCRICRQPVRRDYCRQCDVMFVTCACVDNDEATKHATHRRYLRFPVTEARQRAIRGALCHALAESLTDKDAKCPTCGKGHPHWHVEHYDEIWRDGDVVCECGTRIRSYDAG